MQPTKTINYDRIRDMLDACREPDCLETLVAQMQTGTVALASAAPRPMSPEEAVLRLLIDLRASRTT